MKNTGCISCIGRIDIHDAYWAGNPLCASPEQSIIHDNRSSREDCSWSCPILKQSLLKYIILEDCIWNQPSVPIPIFKPKNAIPTRPVSYFLQLSYSWELIESHSEKKPRELFWSYLQGKTLGTVLIESHSEKPF